MKIWEIKQYAEFDTAARITLVIAPQSVMDVSEHIQTGAFVSCVINAILGVPRILCLHLKIFCETPVVDVLDVKL